MQTDQTPNTEDAPALLSWIPRTYLYVGVAALGLLIIAATIAAFTIMRHPGPGAEQASALDPAPTHTPAAPTDIPTELPPALDEGQSASAAGIELPAPTSTVELASPPLPTVTPTPELPPASPREIVISGSTTMRLALSGEGFDSTGRPLRFQIQPRTLTLGGDLASTSDSWCIQLGLVNESFDLIMSLTPGTEELVVTGSIALREGFCEQPGEEMDTAEVYLTVPTDAAGQISYNLRGERSLLGLSGLLDTDTGSIVELRVANQRPE